MSDSDATDALPPGRVKRWLQDLEDDLAAANERITTLERQLAEYEDRLADHDRRLDDLDAATDLLRIVEKSDDLDREQKATVLLEHCREKARSYERRGQSPVVTIDWEDAEEILHYPDQDRTTFYTDLQKAAQLIGDDRVCEYSDGELTLRLDGVDRFNTDLGVDR